MGWWLLRLPVEILAILQPKVNPKLNIVVRKYFFASSITKHFYLSIAGKFYSKAKWKKVRDLSDYRHDNLAAVGMRQHKFTLVRLISSSVNRGRIDCLCAFRTNWSFSVHSSYLYLKWIPPTTSTHEDSSLSLHSVGVIIESQWAISCKIPSADNIKTFFLTLSYFENEELIFIKQHVSLRECLPFKSLQC